MGDRNYYNTSELDPGLRALFDDVQEKFETQVAHHHAKNITRLRKAAADAEALLFIAEMKCPEDVRRFGQDHRIPLFAEKTWQAGFQAGWRAHHSRSKRDGTHSP